MPPGHEIGVWKMGDPAWGVDATTVEYIALEIYDEEEEIARVKADGSVAFGDRYSADRAAEILWKTVADFLRVSECHPLREAHAPLLTIAHGEWCIRLKADGSVAADDVPPDAHEFWEDMATRLPDHLRCPRSMGATLIEQDCRPGTLEFSVAPDLREPGC
jgi:hypothetical protein